MVSDEVSSLQRKMIMETLDDGESVIWIGVPCHGVVFRKQDIFFIPFSLIFFGFSVFWELSVLSLDGSPVIFKFWGVPFVVIGFYLCVGRFFYDRWRRCRIVYGLTNQRILIVASGARKSMDLTALGEINLRFRGDGCGSIVFGPEINPFTRRDLGMWSGAPTVPTFEGIKDVQQVFASIREARRSINTAAG